MMNVGRRAFLRAGLATGAAMALMIGGDQQALALLTADMLNQDTPLGSDYTVFRSVNKLTARPHNYKLYEVPNAIMVDPFFRPSINAGQGYACAVHGFSSHRGGVMAPDLMGVTPGTGERPLLGRAHYVVIEVPNPAWKSTTNPINGRWLHWEGLITLNEVAFGSTTGFNRTEIWYLAMKRGQHDIGGQFGFTRTSANTIVFDRGLCSWTTRSGFGDGNTPFRPGDEGVPSLRVMPKVGNGVSFRVDNALYFKDIPRDAGGHTHGMETTAWLRHSDLTYPAGDPTPPPGINMKRVFPRMPVGADFDPDPAILEQLSPTARAAYLALNN